MKNNFTCDECSFAAPNRSRIRIHKLSVHSDVRPWKCTFPGCNFATKHKGNLKLKLHFNTHESNPDVRKPFPCKFTSCEYRAAQKGALDLHLKAKHTPFRSKDFQCTLCPSRFYTKDALTGHISRHVKEIKFECDLCKFFSHDKVCLNRHLKTVHGKGTRFQCAFPGCNYSAAYQSYVNQHKKTHDTDPQARLRFPCNFSDCNFRCSNRKDLKKHIDARHNPDRTKQFPCPLCPKRFYSLHGVKSHSKLVHTKEKTYGCDQCSFNTHYGNRLKAHQWTEHGIGKAREKKFKCDSCEHRAYSRHHLELHKLATHTKEKRFACHFLGCGYKTFYPVALKHHMLIHEEDTEKQYPFACTFRGCDFRRRFRKQMERHEKWHEESIGGAESFKCASCTKSYPDTVSLDFHNRVSHQTESHKCARCNYTTRIRRNLWQHSRHHHPSQKLLQPTEKYLQSRRAGRGQNSQDVTRSGKKLRKKGDIVDMAASTTHRLPIVILQRIHIILPQIIN